MPLEDKEARLRVMRKLAKFDVDTSRLDLKLINSVVYLGGFISRVRRPGAPDNMRKVLEDMEETVRGMRGIADVVNDVRIM